MTKPIDKGGGWRVDGMAAERVRKRIQLTKLMQRLHDNAEGKIEMSAQQVDSAKFLVNKAMPNLPERSEVNMSGGVSISWPLSKSKLDQ